MARDKNIKILEKELKILIDKLDKLSKRHNRVFKLYEEGIIDKVTLS